MLESPNIMVADAFSAGLLKIVDVSFTNIEDVGETGATADDHAGLTLTGGDDFDDIVPETAAAWSGRVHLLAAIYAGDDGETTITVSMLHG